MSSDQLLIKLTVKSLVQKYVHPYDSDFSKYVTQTEYDDILRLLNEHTRLAMSGPRKFLSWGLFPVGMAFCAYSGYKSSDNGFSTIFIAFGCLLLTFFSLFVSIYLANRGAHPAFVQHINDINLKYAGKIKAKLETVHTGTTVTTTTYSSGGSSTSVTQHYDYNVYLFGLKPQGSNFSSPAPSYKSTPDYGVQGTLGSNNTGYNSVYSPGGYSTQGSNYSSAPSQNYQPTQNYQAAQNHGNQSYRAPQYQTNPNGNRVPQNSQYQYGK
ncbi:hypothetical protein HK103_006841 [Boothiomyces macroporosus]|uniref:Uncharacterized protein n=1 Tax=Boothiomyces macroporosus TaxID=261099 RepID=A0AAD5UD81_9FUNG|nr:hypothetical protein HK103_006841 [Boothiomyces macroporosus]